MLFHTWPFLVFLVIVLPVYYALGRTRLWMPWLTAASYFFYGWWNPYYLFLVAYSTALDYFLVTFMDHCPRAGEKVDWVARLTRLRFGDSVLCAPPSWDPRPLRCSCAPAPCSPLPACGLPSECWR